MIRRLIIKHYLMFLPHLTTSRLISRNGIYVARSLFIQSSAPLRFLSKPLIPAVTYQKSHGRYSLSAPSSRVNFRQLSTKAKLDPPNDEADWVIVDVNTEDLAPDTLPPSFTDDIGDDAKSLVRVLLRDASAELSVVLCSDEHIKFLNSMWRGVDSATDVLSFAQANVDNVVLGDVVISIETAREQALENGYQLRDEVRVLLAHGVLHLLGYDHEGKKDGDWIIMARMENRLLNDLGWKGEGLVSTGKDPFYRDIVKP